MVEALFKFLTIFFQKSLFLLPNLSFSLYTPFAMSSTRGQKRNYITISSSSSSSSSEDDDYEEDYDPQSESDYTHQLPEVEQISSSSSCYDDDDDDEEEDCDGERGSCDRVIGRLQDKGDLHEFKLRDCHSYLRQHGLRITGTKTECVERIMTHWRIKDGNAEALYPRSSFVLDCTGDVCRGDVVLFKQKVKMFINKKRSKQFPCIRTVAGRVIRESYGGGKQQHTFTIEVLWSKSCKRAEQLPPLSYLLVKGRKLYRMRTFRQLWDNESKRHEVLAEKHERGDTARLVRAMNKGMEKGFSKNKGIKRPKQAHTTPSTSGKRADAKRENRGRSKTEMVKSTKHRQKAPRENLKKKTKAKAPESSTKRRNSTQPYKKQCSIAQSYPYPSQSFPQIQMQPNLPFHPHHPLHNYDPNFQFSQFSPQNFLQRQLHPNVSQYSQNYQDTNGQSNPYPQHNFHPSQTHDIRAHSHHPQSFQQSQMQYHHQRWNGDGVFPHYVNPPIIQVSRKQRFEPCLR